MESELVEKLKKKDLNSLHWIVTKYNKRIFSLAFHYVNNIEDAEDIVQEAWMKFFSSLERFKGHSSLYTYLYRIAMNEALLHLRRNKIKRLLINYDKEIPDEITPETLYLQNEEGKSINEAMKDLPHKQKQVFLLRKSENLSFKEIGELMHIKENNAKVLFFYALQKVKNYLKEKGVL